MNVLHNRATAGLIADHPELAALLGQRYADATGFMADMRRALESGRMSDRQIAAACKSVARDAQMDAQRAKWNAESAALAATGVKVPTGRIQVTGEIMSAREKVTDFGVSVKMTVKLDDGCKVFGTLPSALEPSNYDLDSLKGRRITFVGTLEASENDPTFGFFKRPSKAAFVN